jgi:hypothetical protein
MAEEPVPITATRRPTKSTGSCGHSPVWKGSALVQEYNFSPGGATYQREEQRFNVRQVTHLRLTIIPNKSGSGTATLTQGRLDTDLPEDK